MRIGIVGGGLTGLTAALDLVRRGHQVTVWEQHTELGGQVSIFPVGDSKLERFYHHMFTGDRALIALISEMGLSSSLQWLPSRVGYYYDGKVHGFTTPLDLIRFSPLGLVDRVRVGLLSLYLQRSADWRRFEGVTARDWLQRRMGQRSYEVIWGPLLRGKFGDSADDIGMAWMWGRLRVRLGSRRGGGGERLGYLNGSFGRLVDAMARQVLAGGGAIATGTAIKRILIQENHLVGVASAKGETIPEDAVLVTAPSPAFLDMAPDLPADYASKVKAVRYLAAMCLALVVKKPFGSVYWLNIGDRSFPFVATIEQTNFVSPATYSGKHILYVSNYLPSASPLYQMEPEALLGHYLPHLKKINPQFDASWVENYHVSREEFAQPVVPTGYSSQVPGHITPIGGLYLANTSQIYPEDRGMNQAVQLGLKVAGLMG